MSNTAWGIMMHQRNGNGLFLHASNDKLTPHNNHHKQKEKHT